MEGPAKKATKRKAEESHGPKEGEELYLGTVRQQSTKDPSMYLVTCPIVTDWYGAEAKVSADVLFLAGAGVGDELLFTLADEGEDADAAPAKKGAKKGPMVAWAERSDSASAKKRIRAASGIADEDGPPAEGKAKANSKTKASVKAAAEAGTAPTEVGELQKLKEELHAERTAKLEAMLEAERTKAAVHKAELERLRGQAPAAAEPEGDVSEDSADEVLAAAMNSSQSTSQGKGKGKNKSKGKGKDKGKGAGDSRGAGTTVGELRFADAEAALAALALYGTELNGAEVKPEADADSTRIRVKGLAPGTSPTQLRIHFSEAGSILSCSVNGQQESDKGRGNDKGGGKDKGRGKDKGHGKYNDARQGLGVAGRASMGEGRFMEGGGGGSRTAIGEVIFWEAWEAEAALELYGTTLKSYPGGQPLRVELDPRFHDGTKIKVFGLPAGLPQEALRKHFQACGQIRSILTQDVRRP